MDSASIIASSKSSVTANPNEKDAMTALEVYRNGRKTCTAGLNRSGAVISSLIWSSGGSSEAQHEELELRVSGYITRNAAHVSWCSRRLQVGDEIKVVVVERARVDRPVRRRVESATTRLKRERAYVERKAKEYGWTIAKP